MMVDYTVVVYNSCSSKCWPADRKNPDQATRIIVMKLTQVRCCWKTASRNPRLQAQVVSSRKQSMLQSDVEGGQSFERGRDCGSSARAIKALRWGEKKRRRLLLLYYGLYGVILG